VDLALAAVPLGPGFEGLGITVTSLQRRLFPGRLFVSASADKLFGWDCMKPSKWITKGHSRNRRYHSPARVRLAMETLESRVMLVGEGAVFSFDRVVSTAGLLGNVSAVALWGNGSQSNVVVGATPAAGPIRPRFDYSLDTTGFFNVQERRDILQVAADIVFSKFSDVLTAITPSGTNTWQAVFPNPTTGATQVINGGVIAANEIVIYVGARDLPGTTVAQGGPGGLGWSGTTAWGQSVTSRGQPGALGTTLTDIGPWGGSMTVDPTIKWHFGATTQGLDSDEYDFLSVVSHEFMHIFGYGITRPDVTSSWTRLVSNGFFTGANARAANGGVNVRLSGNQEHWAEGTQSNGQEALMDPSINNTGIRKLPTPLDVAGLQDIGWQLIPQQIQVSGSTIYGDDGSFPATIVVSGATAGQLTVDLGVVSVTNVAPTITASTTAKSTRVNVPLSITDIANFSDPGFGPSETFRYEIDWGDNLPGGASLASGVATVDRAGGANVLTLGSFNGSHTYSATGTYNVTYRIIDDNGGAAQQSFTVQVLTPPEIVLTLSSTSINEAAGPSATSLIIDLLGFDNSVPVTINLSSSDPSEASIAPSVTFVPGTTRATVSISAVDDALLDGSQFVSFTASSGSISATSALLEVIDLESVLLSLSTTTVREDAGAGAAILRVTRSNTDLQSAVGVALTSSIPGVILPALVTIPANSAFVDVGVTVVDDSLVNGTRTALLRGMSALYAASELLLTINDYEPIQWVSVPITLSEGTGPSSASIDLTIPAPAPAEGVVLALSPSVSGQLIIPAMVTIPAGQTRVSVPINVVEDNFSENHQDVLIVAAAVGYVPSTTSVRVLDNDRSAWTNPNDIYDVNGEEGVTARDILNVINYINSKGIGPLPPTRPSSELFWVDVSGNGFIEPLDILLIINLLNLRST
jgi:hypothetical protein